MENPQLNMFSGGLVTDDNPLYQRDGTYTHLLNGRKLIEDQVAFGLSNALSNQLHASGLGEVVGITLIEERDQFIVFSRNGGATIYLVSSITGEVKELINLSGCGVDFSSCENIYAEMKTMQPCSELFIYFSSNCVYYVLNVDALLDEKRRGDYECDDYLLFKCVCVPEIEAQIDSAAGGNIEAGAYRFVVQLEDTDGNTTNWFNVSYPISIESENNIAGENSKRSIRINITGLDPRYRKINLTVIKNIAGVETYETFPSFFYSGNTFSYEYYGQQGAGILLEELLTKKRSYIKGKDLIQKDNQLLLYNILQRRNLDYQRRANNIRVKGVLYVAKAEDAHKYRTLIRGERYLTSIGWNHCSGEKTNAFVLSNYGGFSSVDLGLDFHSQELLDKILPRTDSTGGDTGSTGTTNRDYVTLEGTRSDDPFNPNNPDGVPDDTVDEIQDELGEADPATEADPCVDCGNSQLQEGLDLGNSFGTSSIDFITNIIRRTRIRGKNKIKSGNLKQAIQSFLDEVKDLDDDEEENKEVYDVVNYTPVPRNNDNFNDFEKSLRDNDLAKIGEFDFKVFESSQVYPNTKDCMGEFIYGDLAGQPIKLIEIPDESEIPFFISFQNGVKSQKTLGVDEFADAYAFFIGLKLENIEFPVDDELHTPLCEETPYTVYFAETTPINRRIVAKGLMPHTFMGKMNGKEYAFPKHAVNSIEHVDRHIQAIDDIGPGSHMGYSHRLPLFTFISPDTSVGKPLLNVDNAFIPGELNGKGWMHGQYAYGDEPTNAFFGRQKDQRGVRQSINLNKPDFTGNTFSIPVDGITFAKGNKVITNANGIDYGLCNLYRDSSVYMQLASMPDPLRQGKQNGYGDHSFVGRGMDHSCEIPYAASHYAVLRNEIPDQYGSVESLIYVDTGLSARGRETSIEGIAGDGFIGPWTVKRTSYVSNKVGDEAILPSRRRVGGFLQYFGFGDCTRPPDSGDDRDIKNKKNLHPNLRCSDAIPDAPETDLFFPRTLNTMVAFWVESRINVWYRATGVETGKVFYPKLKDLELDSSVPNGTAWETGWLNRFHCLINRASKFLIAVRAALRIGIFIGGLAFIVSQIVANSIPDLFLFILRIVLLIAIWVFAFFFVFTNRNINKLLGLDECLDDRQGAFDHEQIRGWEDNYHDYNFDYSLQNRYNYAVGMPDPYNVCDCDDCASNQVTHEIYISNPQVVSSPIDAYKNFNANSFLKFPLDAGKITKLIDFQGRLLAHTTETLKVLSYKHSIELNEGNIAVSNGGFISHPETIGGDVPEGMFGLQHPQHSFLFAGGYVFVDEKAKKIWLVRSLGEISDITNQFNKALFRDKLPFCTTDACKGEGMPDEIGYQFGYDPLEELLYITKKDGECASFTVSYDMERQNWFGFHSFIPQRYIHTRSDFFSLNDEGLWIHNKNKADFQTYYGKFYPHEIEFVSKDNIFNIKELDHFSFYTQANRHTGCREASVYNLPYTFNKAVFYNTSQCSGELLLDFKSDALGNRDNLLDEVRDKGLNVPLVWQGENWQLNRIRDFTKSYEMPIWECDCYCSPFKKLNYANIDPNKNWQNSNIILDRYLKARLIFDSELAKNTQLITHFSLAHSKGEIH